VNRKPLSPLAREIIESLLFVAFIVGYAAVYRDTFARLQELSPLLPDTFSPRDLLEWPGTALRLAGSFLTRLFAYPLVGGLLLAVILVSTRWLLLPASRLPAAARWLAYLPALLLFLAVVRLDHVVFVPAGENYLVAPSLGLLLALVVVVVTRHARRQRLYIALAVAVGYPLLGCYALLAVLFVGRRYAWTVAWVIAYPLLYLVLHGRLSLFDAYTAGLLLPANHGATWWNWLPIPAALVAVAAIVLPGGKSRGETKRAGLVNAAGLVASCVAVVFLANRDASFHALLSMQYHAARDRWDVVLERARTVTSPDRLVILYRDVALFKRQRLCDEMFTFPREGDDMPPYPGAVYIAGPDLLFHHGQLNHAYRWAVERFVQHGMTVDALRVMARVALLNGEFPLAIKHADALARVPFHASEADVYRQHAARPATLLKASFLPRGLSPRENRLGEKTALLEPFLLEYHRDAPPDTREALELSVAAALVLKVTERFHALFPLYGQNGIALPRHVREAALLFARLEQRDEEAIPGIDAVTRQRFDRFLAALVDVQAMPAAQRSFVALAKQFGDTYWYYYFAVKNLKTN
jgi:hypothetical protein